METKTKHALFETQKKKSHTHTHTGTVKPPLFGPRPPPIVRPRAREKATPPTPPRPLLGRVLSVFFFFVFLVCFLFVFCLLGPPTKWGRSHRKASQPSRCVCLVGIVRRPVHYVKLDPPATNTETRNRKKEKKKERKQFLPSHVVPHRVVFQYCDVAVVGQDVAASLKKTNVRFYFNFFKKIFGSVSGGRHNRVSVPFPRASFTWRYLFFSFFKNIFCILLRNPAKIPSPSPRHEELERSPVFHLLPDTPLRPRPRPPYFSLSAPSRYETKISICEHRKPTHPLHSSAFVETKTKQKRWFVCFFRSSSSSCVCVGVFPCRCRTKKVKTEYFVRFVFVFRSFVRPTTNPAREKKRTSITCLCVSLVFSLLYFCFSPPPPLSSVFASCWPSFFIFIVFYECVCACSSFWLFVFLSPKPSSCILRCRFLCSDWSSRGPGWRHSGRCWESHCERQVCGGMKEKKTQANTVPDRLSFSGRSFGDQSGDRICGARKISVPNTAPLPHPAFSALHPRNQWARGQCDATMFPACVLIGSSGPGWRHSGNRVPTRSVFIVWWPVFFVPTRSRPPIGRLFSKTSLSDGRSDWGRHCQCFATFLSLSLSVCASINLSLHLSLLRISNVGIRQSYSSNPLVSSFFFVSLSLEERKWENNYKTKTPHTLHTNTNERNKMSTTRHVVAPRRLLLFISFLLPLLFLNFRFGSFFLRLFFFGRFLFLKRILRIVYCRSRDSFSTVSFSSFRCFSSLSSTSSSSSSSFCRNVNVDHGDSLFFNNTQGSFLTHSSFYLQVLPSFTEFFFLCCSVSNLVQ